MADGKVVLVDHDPRWKSEYRKERDAVRGALFGVLIDVQHCGSTAIPGIKSKPILDIVASVKDLDVGRSCIPMLREIGYDYIGNAAIPDQHFFAKGHPRTHHLHLVPHKAQSWFNKTVFRDRLLADFDLARLYEAFKVRLAGSFPDDRASYTAAKSAFVQSVIHSSAGISD